MTPPRDILQVLTGIVDALPWELQDEEPESPGPDPRDDDMPPDVDLADYGRTPHA